MQRLHTTTKKSPCTKTRTSLAIALGISALFSSADVLACAACGCTLSKDWGTQGITTTPGFTADLSYFYINQNQQRIGTSTASQAQIGALNGAATPQEIEDYTTTRTTTAALTYTSDIWSVTANLPFVQRTHGTFGNGGTWPAADNYSSSSDNGIGDLSVVGRYTGFSAEKTSGLIAGVKLPTGRTDANFNSGAGAGTALDRSLQIGTGSTDVILGAYTTGAIDTYGWFVQGTVQHAVVTKTIAGQDYRPGDSYSLNTGIRYAKFGSRFSPMLQLNIINRRADTGTGATPPDALTGNPATGGTLAYLAPGIMARVGGGTSVYGFVQLPIYQNVNSLQLGARYTATLGVRQSF
jgi:hypothetical protein